MKLNLKVLLLAVFFAVALAASAYLFLSVFKEEDGGNRDFKEILRDGKLHVVTEYSSTGYYVSGDSVSGFNYELLQMLEKEFPVEIEIHLEANIDSSIKGLNSGKYDLVASYVPITSELKEEVCFTGVQIKNKQVLVQRRQDSTDLKPVRTMLDLAGKTIHVSQNSPVLLRLKNLIDEIGDTIYYKENALYGPEQLMLEVASGNIDYAICNEQIALKMAEKLPELDFDTFIGFTHFEAWAVRKSSPVLADSINAWFSKIKDMKKGKEIFKSYYLN